MLGNILVTGGCGFIASHLINYLGNTYDCNIINIDKMGYCSRRENVTLTKNYQLLELNLNTSIDMLVCILKHYKIDTVFHLAAESHVDNSFEDPLLFTRENVLGTHNLLEACKIYGNIQKFIHMSTDEVYGSTLGEVDEQATLNPTNPYSGSKAAVEMIMRPYQLAYNLPVITVRCNNIYGSNQYPEKVIPKFVKNLLKEEKCFIQGDGKQTRSFLHVADAVRALDIVRNHGTIGEIYNIGSDNEIEIGQLAEIIIKYIGKGKVVLVEDRKFNDKCYLINCDKIKSLGWKQEIDFEQGLKECVDSYLYCV